MNGLALSRGFADPPLEAALTFRAALDALARPGTLRQVPGVQAPSPLSEGAGALLLTLIDAETPLYLAGASDRQAVRDWLAFHTGAPIVAAAECRFAVGTWPALAPLSRFPGGTPERPDAAATLIVEMAELRTEGVRLAGPGIEGAAALNLPEIAAFAANAARYPLGCDLLFCAGRTIAGLPRSTRVATPQAEPG